MKNLFKIMLAASLCVSASIAAPQKGMMTDLRDGKKYKTVTIGQQTWMAENLNYKTPKSKCSQNKKANCSKYGRLYYYEEENVCPSGWHIPSVKEWDELFSFVEADKTCSDFGYDDGSGDDDCDYISLPMAKDKLNKLGFSILMGGDGWGYGIGEYAHFGVIGKTHFATKYGGGSLYCFQKAFSGASDYCTNDGFSGYYSVRCIKDEKNKNVGDGLAGLLSGATNGNEQKKSADTNEGNCSNSNVLDLTVLLKDDYVTIGVRGGFLPNIYFKEMWTFRCRADGKRVTYSAKDVWKNLERGVGPKCQNGSKISPDTYVNELEKIELWTIEKESVNKLVEDMLMNELSQIYRQFKNLDDASKVRIFVEDVRDHDMKWLKKKYGPILNKIQKLRFKEIYFPNDVERSVLSETENAVYYDTRFDVKYDDTLANQLYRTFGVRKPSEADFAKENKRCHNSFVTVEMKNEQAFNENIDKVFKDSAAVDKILKDVAAKMSKGKYSSESSGGGVGDGLAGLLGGGNGKTSTKAMVGVEDHDALDAKNTCNRRSADIMKVVRQRTPGLQPFYNKALKNERYFQGIVKIKFVIQPEGSVAETSIVSSTTGNDAFDNEISAAVKRWNFGKYKCSDGNVANVTTVTIPFTFSE